MMASSRSSAHAQLHAIDPLRAQTQTALIAALNHREIDDLRIVARLAGARDRRAAAAWIRFDTGGGPILIAPLLVGNQLARMTLGPGRPDAAAAAATLGRIEPLVAAIETVLGIELHPAGLLAAVVGEPLMLRLDAHEQGGALSHRLLIAVPERIDIDPLPLPRDIPRRVGALNVGWRGRVVLPPIPARRLAALAPGDCIVLGGGAISASLTLPGRNDRVPIVLDLKGGSAILGRAPEEGVAIVSDRISPTGDVASASPADPPGLADLTIASVIEFDGGRLTAGEVAMLGEGSVLPLPATGGVLAVRVVAGGARIADGELVAVGEGFGVLVTALHPVDAG